MTELRGIDVSHHNSFNAINYVELAKTHQFLIARATYGVRRDEYCGDHIKRARDAGLTTGLYHFFRSSQDAAEQLDAFADVAAKIGMGPGWVAPALDVEQNEAYDGKTTPEGYAPAEHMVREWLALHGAALIYTNPVTWQLIGSPRWIEIAALWIAHTGVAEPKTPHGLPWTIWQHRVAPLPGVLNAQLDQNVARSLPLLQKWEPAPITPELDWPELRRDRDRMVRESDDE